MKRLLLLAIALAATGCGTTAATITHATKTVTATVTRAPRGLPWWRGVPTERTISAQALKSDRIAGFLPSDRVVFDRKYRKELGSVAEGRCAMNRLGIRNDDWHLDAFMLAFDAHDRAAETAFGRAIGKCFARELSKSLSRSG